MDKLSKLMLQEPIKAEVKADSNELYLYGTVGDAWDGITLKDVKRKAEAIESNHVKLHINSYGGDATEGVAIRNYLKDKFDTIEAVIDGIAASAASIIALSGDTVDMPSGSTLMIHNPHTIAIGNRTELLKTVKALESLEESYKDIYMEHFSGSREELSELMDNESWLGAEEAKAYGFVTAVEDGEDNLPSYAALLEAKIANIDVKDVTENIGEFKEQPKAQEKNVLLKRIFKSLKEGEK